MSVFDLLYPHGLPHDIKHCFEAIRVDGLEDYCQLATCLVHAWKKTTSTRIGLGGGQGAGKSTLCDLLQKAARYYGQEIAVLGIDDFYLTKDERSELAETVHPAFATRGPPGTHHVDWLIDVIQQLERGEQVSVPVFDKGIDDRSGERVIDNVPRWIVVEGWCVGATQEHPTRLINPVNDMERTHDRELRWRSYVNDRLGSEYAALNNLLQRIVFLQVPSIEAVNAWRWQQESERPAERRMSPDQVSEFVQYYERITNWMIDDLPDKADWTVVLNAEHRVEGLRRASTS